jgi:hypothetical protein
LGGITFIIVKESIKVTPRADVILLNFIYQ